MEVHNNKLKPTLTTSSFIFQFEFGINNDGYWDM